MIHTRQEVHSSIQALVTYYRSLPAGHLGHKFFPCSISVLLDRDDTRKPPIFLAREIFDIFLSVEHFFLRAYGESFRNFFDAHLLDCARILKQCRALTVENFKMIAEYGNLSTVFSVLNVLHQAGLLSGREAQANFVAVLQHAHLASASAALSVLHQAGLLSGNDAQVNFTAVMANRDYWQLAYVLSDLFHFNLLRNEKAQQNLMTVVKYRNLSSVVIVLRILHSVGLLTEETKQARFEAVVHHPHLFGLTSLLDLLKTASLLTEKSYLLVLKHTKILCARVLDWAALPPDCFSHDADLFESLIAICDNGQPVFKRQELLMQKLTSISAAQAVVVSAPQIPTGSLAFFVSERGAERALPHVTQLHENACIPSVERGSS